MAHNPLGFFSLADDSTYVRESNSWSPAILREALENRPRKPKLISAWFAARRPKETGFPHTPMRIMMNRMNRNQSRWPLVAAVIACWCPALLMAADSTAKPARQNLLIIQTDEHHYGTLGCYGGKIVGTPHLDWIAKQGARCDAFYATTPVCSPSRAAFVTGRYPQKTPVVTNNIPLNDSVVTFAEILRRQGYATGYAGKWHLDGGGKPQWAPKRQFGFSDNRFMFNRGHWKKFLDAAEGPRVGARGANGKPSYGLDGADEKTFATDWLCDKAIHFIREHADKPFCYMVSLPDPHGPNTVRAPYATMYDDVEVPIPATLQRKPGQIPAWGKSAGVTAQQLRKLMPKYYGMVKCIDDNVGRILAELRERKLIDRTVIVFTSDHGDLCGEHGRLNKGVPYEGSARIPFLIRAPGQIKPGTVIAEALSCVDFLPTATSLLKIDHDQPVDGRDASKLFQGEAEDWDDLAFLRSTPNSPWVCAVSKKYKLVYSASDEPWLIDLQADPNEVTNEFGLEKHKQRIKQMTTRLYEYCRLHQDEHARVPRIHQEINAVLK
ncbi:MAG: sulfatase [Planctomycetales bacterium]